MSIIAKIVKPSNKKAILEAYNEFVANGTTDGGKCPYRSCSNRYFGYEAARRTVQRLQLQDVYDAHSKIQAAKSIEEVIQYDTINDAFFGC